MVAINTCCNASLPFALTFISTLHSPFAKRRSFSSICFFVFSVQGTYMLWHRAMKRCAPTKETKKFFMAYNSVIFPCPLAVSLTEEEERTKQQPSVCYWPSEPPFVSLVKQRVLISGSKSRCIILPFSGQKQGRKPTLHFVLRVHCGAGPHELLQHTRAFCKHRQRRGSGLGKQAAGLWGMLWLTRKGYNWPLSCLFNSTGFLIQNPIYSAALLWREE